MISLIVSLAVLLLAALVYGLALLAPALLKPIAVFLLMVLLYGCIYFLPVRGKSKPPEDKP